MKKLNARQLFKDNQILLDSLASKDRTIAEQSGIIKDLKQRLSTRVAVDDTLNALSNIAEAAARLAMASIGNK